MENELNMTRMMSNKSKPEDQARISELEAQVEHQRTEHESEVAVFKEKFEKV